VRTADPLPYSARGSAAHAKGETVAEQRVISNTREFEGVAFDMASFAGASMRNVSFVGVKMEGLFVNAEITGPIDGLKINGVEVAPLIEAELVRRHPELAKFTAVDLGEVREGLQIVEEQLGATLRRAGALPEDVRNRRVDGEWSAVETVRHLVFVVDLHVRRQALGLGADAYHPIGLPPSHLPPSLPGTGIDVEARPSFEEAVTVWDGRLAEVRDLLRRSTPAEADATHPIDSPGFPPLTETIPLRRAVGVVLREIWAHNRYLERDLPALEAGTEATATGT
jgi:DinB superfamily